MSTGDGGAGFPRPDAALQVLVVEDDPSVRGLLDTLLTAEGYHVTTASDGIEGLSQAVAHQQALILLDLVMPDLDGLRVLETMQADPVLSTVPVLVLTGRLESIGALQDQLGADRVLSKPFGVEDLLARIARLTGKARA